MLRALLYSACVLLFLIIASCGDKTSKDPEPETQSDTSFNVVDSVAARILTIPSPLQVSTLLKLNKEYYREELLSSSKTDKAYPSSYEKSLNLGVSLTDLGYAAVFDQKQKCLDYLKKIQQMMDDLEIQPEIKAAFVKRFKNNLENSDSLSYIILQNYNNAHSYLEKNGKQDVGFYILCGSYIEGLHVLSHSSSVMKEERAKNMLGQQKLFLENIFELFSYFDQNQDRDELFQMLVTIYNGFDGVVIRKNEDSGKITVGFTDKDLEKIRKAVSSTRKRITG